MKQILNTLSNKSILILGLGREGLSTYLFLRKYFPDKEIAFADKKNLTELEEKFQALIKKDKNLKFKLGKNHLKELEKYDLIFKTPGIPASLAQIKKALQKGTKLSSNTQLFFEIMQQQKNNLGPTIIGVTGTKGKSTTASLIYHVLKENKLDTILIGNIGTPPLSLVDQIESKAKVVIELSSHQLSELTLPPQIAVVQEITVEHLDYYHSVDEYVEAKSAITRYQKNDKYKVIYNPNFQKTTQLAKLSKGQHLKHGLQEQKDLQVYIKDDWVIFNKLGAQNNGNEEEKIIKTNDIPLLGKHNLFNVMPAIIIAKAFGLPNAKISAAIKNFKGLPHRLELVAKTKGVKYYNDSLATTPEATISAIESLQSQLPADNQIILLAGGHERLLDYSPLATEILKNKVKTLILFPTTGKRIWKEITQNASYKNLKKTEKTKLKHFFVKNMHEAITLASKIAKEGDVVLLSPASASFGLFKDYKDRGEQFKKEIDNLA